MRVVLIGATGTIGRAVAQAIAINNEVVRVSRTSGEYRVDMSSKESVQRLNARIAAFDALVCAAGQARFAPFEALSDEDFQFIRRVVSSVTESIVARSAPPVWRRR
jgi:short-subunit dehydrogenase